MKKLLTLFTVMVFAVSISCSQTTNQENKNNKAPKIEFEFTVYDYGTVQQGGNGTCEFAFTNKGKEALLLTNVKSTCGCTVPSWPKEPVKKGGVSKIVVKYNTNRLGPINKSVTVTSNASNSPVILKIKGKVIPKAEKTEEAG
jgi:hypothetical protein